MSDGERDETWGDWTPDHEGSDIERFKWGWNAVDGEVVWAVSEPGDGLPSHSEQLSSAWGREPSLASGDVLGAASLHRSEERGAGVVVIDVYYGANVPTKVVRWFRGVFPDAQLRLPAGD